MLSLSINTEGQTLYQYKDESGAVVISDRPPEKKVKSMKELKYKEKEAQPAPSRGTTPADQGVKIGSERQAPVSQQEMEKRWIEEQQKAAAEQKAKREEAARKLEEEAKKPQPYSRENVQKQVELLEKAQRIRSGKEPLQ